MKYSALTLLLAFAFATALSACGREQEEPARTAAETQQAPQPSDQTEITTGESGTTTYFGSNQEQANN